MTTTTTTTSTSSSSSSSSSPSSSFMVAIECGRKTSAGTTVRCCVAFGASCLCLIGVGRPRFAKHGSFGTVKFLDTKTFPSWAALRQCADRDGWQVVGISSPPSSSSSSLLLEDGTHIISRPVQERNFDGPTIFVSPSKKEKTLTKEQLAACHSLVHVPISGGPASEAAFAPHGPMLLDADVALSIVLHHFTAWGQRTRHCFEGSKYVLGDPGDKALQVDGEERQRVQEERRRQREVADVMSKQREEEEAGGFVPLWGVEEEDDDEEEA